MSDVNRSLNIFFNSEQLSAQLDKLTRKAQSLEKQMADVGDKSSPEFIKLNRELNTTSEKIDNVSKRLSGTLGPSLKQVGAEVTKVWNQLNNLPIGSPEWKAKLQEFNKLNNEFIKLKGEVGQVGKQMETFAQKVKTVAFGTGIALLSQQAMMFVSSIVPQMLKGMGELSDQLSDIRKTTGLSAADVKQLNSELGQLNTRTATKELRDMAVVAGQLGISGRKDILDFVSATDKLAVALGDEFSGGAKQISDEVGRLRNVFSDIKSDNISDDLLNIGNALNKVASQGSATAPVMVDFANRIGGVGITLGLTSGQVLGLSATLQELNVNAERGSTAIVKILQKITSDTATFAKIAGVPLEQFTELVNKDLYAAFMKVIEGSKRLGTSSTALSGVIKELELQGAGASEVFAKLGQNTDLLQKRVTSASDALGNQNSIMAEFNEKNNNLAGQLERINKWLTASFANNIITQGLAKIVKYMADWIEVPLSQKLRDEQLELQRTTTQIFSYNEGSKERTQLIEQLQEQYPDYLSNLDAETVSNEELRAALDKVNNSMIQRIALQKMDEEALKQEEAAADALIEKNEEERELLKELTYLTTSRSTAANQYNQKQIEGLSIAEASRRILSGDIKLQEVASVSLTELKTRLDNYNNALGEYILQESKAQKVREGVLRFEQNLKNSSGQITSLGEVTITASRNPAAAVTDAAKKVKKAIEDALTGDDLYRIAIGLVNEQIEYGRIALKEQLAQGLIDQEEYQGRLIALETTGIQARKDVAEDNMATSKQAAKDFYTFDRDLQNAILNEHIRVNNAIAESSDKATDQQIKNAQRVAEEERRLAQEREKIAQFAQQLTSTILSESFNLQQQYDQQELDRYMNENDKRKQALDKRLKMGLLSEQQYNKEVAKLEQEARDRERQFKREQFVSNKMARLTEILINTAVGVSKAVSESPMTGGLPGSAIAATMGAVQAAFVAAQPVPEFEFGERLDRGLRMRGPSHRSRSRGLHIIDPEQNRLVALAEGNEWIVNKESSDKYDGLIENANADNEAGIIRWIMNNPRLNRLAAAEILGTYQTSHHHLYQGSPAYNDAALRQTVHNGFLASSKYMVAGIVTGLANSSYANSRKL